MKERRRAGAGETGAREAEVGDAEARKTRCILVVRLPITSNNRGDHLGTIPIGLGKIVLCWERGKVHPALSIFLKWISTSNGV